ncbi:CPBP family intramembrane glutamic endopeptidase [Arenimonas oryziterrae]|uniref:CAAX prenyl protease 2/Lysostaphin resistance protein A-like domain-containing protein n=1 Tax=Arenimonas oryziterrae DSM 21050 = YC6267 TaxID=1121015 RepID=A0A091AW43_9GAMM|nr:CPBP family intramembrane glutamic endopeptidase [Arenimonas oryziterrae]KFN43676.1 hypothetical protein N789_10390 [Arenimonas oryziterrae DSM 21050 = YC6267]
MTPVSLYSPEPARGWLPWGLLAPILLIVFVAAPVLATDGWMQANHFLEPMGAPIGLRGFYALLTIPFALNLLEVLAWVRWVERRPFTTIGLVGPQPLHKFLHGIAIGAGTVSIVVISIWIAGGLQAGGFFAAWRSPMSLMHVVLLLASFVLQAGTEEIIFRGWLLSAVARKFNVAIAVLLVSLAFTFLHYSPHQPLRIVSCSFLFSVFACVWALHAKSIWGVMGWHTGWNWLLSTGFELPVTGIDANLPALLVALRPHGPDLLTGGTEGPEGSVLCSVFFVVAIALMIWRRRAREAAAAAGVGIRTEESP